DRPGVERVNEIDGTVWGRGPSVSTVGYRSGARQCAHEFRSLLRSAIGSFFDVPPPRTTTVPPDSPTEEIDRRPQSPAARRNRARSPNRIETRQCESGEAPSSNSGTGLR